MEVSFVPEDVLERLYRPLGQFIIAWPIIDVTLAVMVRDVFHSKRDRKPKELIEKAFGKRLKFLTTSFRKAENLNVFCAEWDELSARIWTLKLRREATAHGALTKHEPEGDRYTFSKLDIVNHVTGTHQLTNVRMPLGEIAWAANESLIVSRVLTDFGLRVRQKLVF